MFRKNYFTILFSLYFAFNRKYCCFCTKCSGDREKWNSKKPTARPNLFRARWLKSTAPILKPKVPTAKTNKKGEFSFAGSAAWRDVRTGR